MKQEEVMKTLIKELFKLETLHQEYQDNDTHFVVDVLKEGNTLNIKVELLENEDKKEFEKWLENVDDDLLSEILDEMKEDAIDLDELYNSENYKDVIESIKSKAKEIASRKIEALKKVLN